MELSRIDIFSKDHKKMAINDISNRFTNGLNPA